MRWLGLVAVGCFAVHCGYHLKFGRPPDILWACHVAALLVGIGLLGAWPSCVGVGVLWLLVGVPFWLIDVLAGGEFKPTSVLTHIGGLAVGLVGVRWLGLPGQVWWKASLALLALQGLCRLVTPEKDNVNVAFAVYKGWESWFGSFLVYELFLLVLLTALFAAVEFALRRLLV
jgi:hypothetical protein